VMANSVNRSQKKPPQARGLRGRGEFLPRLNVSGDQDLNRFAEQIRQLLCNHSAQELKKHDLLRVTTAADAANIVAEMDGVLRDRESAKAAEPESADEIFAHMSPYMEAPSAA
jgi:hypothetical protein